MKRSEIYREAARLLEHGDVDFRTPDSPLFACEAIRRVCHWELLMADDAILSFARIFKPRAARTCSPWFGTGFYLDNLNRRILALCFMAAIAEDEERSSRGQGKLQEKAKRK